ncbi:hypothetical protein Tco_0133775 [Tanacetum coccineum]
MGDANPISTFGDYSKPSHEGYRNTIELPVGNNVVPLRSNTIRLVQNERSYHGLWSEDPNQNLKDFLKLVDSLDLDGENRERTRLLNPVTRQTIDQSASGKLHDRNAEESLVLLEDLALYDNKSWNDPRDFGNPAKAISLPQDVLMNKITTSCEICSGPHDTQYCMENPEQAFVEYASLHTDESGSQSNLEGLVSNFMASQDARLSKFEANFKQQQSEMTNKIDTILKAITDRLAGGLPSDMVKNQNLNVNTITSVLSARSYLTIDPQCLSHPSTSINAVKTCSKEACHSHTSLLQTRMGIGIEQTEEPE